ncbi:hypothetical protein FB451DRAFT_1418337 [Mycena latifolia]|nr:hypothetical protein FB451DRAFT_1418337 [Mycena latifolia]
MFLGSVNPPLSCRRSSPHHSQIARLHSHLHMCLVPTAHASPAKYLNTHPSSVPLILILLFSWPVPLVPRPLVLLAGCTFAPSQPSGCPPAAELSAPGRAASGPKLPTP